MLPWTASGWTHKSRCSSRFDIWSSPLLKLYQWYCWKYPLFYKALYTVVDPVDVANQLNEDLRQIHLWAKTLLVTFNTAKSESIIFSRKTRNKPYHPPVFMDQTQIEEMISYKDFVVVLTNVCTWHEPLEYANLWLGPALPLWENLNTQWTDAHYRPSSFSFIRPITEYY